MSSQKGNASRSRPQKYQNKVSFKNDLHDKSHKTKIINNMEIADVCERCKKIIEWKIKYKKYKPLKAPATCTKCTQKTVKHSYHTMCLACANQHKVCPKCGTKTTIIEGCASQKDSLQSDVELQALIKSLPERKRRTFLRYINKNSTNKNAGSKGKSQANNEKQDEEIKSIDNNEMSKDRLLSKLKSLAVNDEDEDDFPDSEDSDWDEYFL